MQQAIYTNTHTVKPSAIPGCGTDTTFAADQQQPLKQRFQKVRLAVSVLGNVLGGAVLLSGMLMLPELVVSLLIR